MKIRITNVPPVEKKHGITKGRVFETTRIGAQKGVLRGCVDIVGDTGKTVTLLGHEWVEATDA